MFRKAAIVLFAGTLGSVSANAEIIAVEATGQVLFNGVAGAPLNGVGSGDTATLSFTVDSNVFDEGIPGDTRGYAINEDSFTLSFAPSGISVGLENPFPAGETPYFTLVDGFPASDGFFVSTSPFSPGGVPLSQTPVQANLDLGYDGATLSSLDILDAVGEYGFSGLTRYGFTLWQVFPDNVRMEIDFTGLTISAPPVPVLEATWGEIKRNFR